MKEKTLIEMRNKIDVLNQITKELIKEMDHLRTLSFGTNKLIKEMPGYKKAIDKLKKEVEKTNVE